MAGTLEAPHLDLPTSSRFFPAALAWGVTFLALLGTPGQPGSPVCTVPSLAVAGDWPSRGLQEAHAWASGVTSHPCGDYSSSFCSPSLAPQHLFPGAQALLRPQVLH